MSANDTTRKKTLTRRSPEKIAELILEAERKGNSAEIRRREGSKENNAEVESLTANEGL